MAQVSSASVRIGDHELRAEYQMTDVTDMGSPGMTYATGPTAYFLDGQEIPEARFRALASGKPYYSFAPLGES